MADRTAAENMQRPQADPRYAVGSDTLMGQHRFSSPDLQAAWDPLILEQCQTIGFAAMLKTMEATAPRQRYVKITQGPREPFLQFVEKVAVALEKQIEDDSLRHYWDFSTGSLAGIGMETLILPGMVMLILVGTSPRGELLWWLLRTGWRSAIL